MDLLEHQGKLLLREVGITTPRGEAASTAAEAATIAARLGGMVAVKAQVRTGGRGKAGGIAVVGASQAAEAAERILGMDIRGHVVKTVLVEEAASPAQEIYAAVVLDRGLKRPVALLSSRGGIDVEDVSRNFPESLARVCVDPLLGWSDYLARRLSSETGLGTDLLPALTEVLRKLYICFERYDSTLVEVNPLGVSQAGELIALDAKVVMDGSSAFRQPHLREWSADAETDPLERAARERGLTYVKLHGNVGILGNGAGLVMSTLDLVGAASGAAANFLDVGGGARADQIVAALEVITADPDVRSILVNIFGGITRCDEVARGVLAAVDQLDFRLPIVVRLDGTNEAEGRRILADANLPELFPEPTMADAAARAVDLATRGSNSGGGPNVHRGPGMRRGN